jgi:hypothetical protein
MDKAKKLSNNIVYQVYSILDQKISSPIIPKWEKEQESGSANIVSNAFEQKKVSGKKNRKMKQKQTPLST